MSGKIPLKRASGWFAAGPEWQRAPQWESLTAGWLKRLPCKYNIRTMAESLEWGKQWIVDTSETAAKAANLKLDSVELGEEDFNTISYPLRLRRGEEIRTVMIPRRILRFAQGDPSVRRHFEAWITELCQRLAEL